jgi:hypothetical protein
VSAKDIAFLKAVCFKRGKRIGSVCAARPQTVLASVVMVAHKLVTGEGYTVEFKTESKAVESAAA